MKLALINGPNLNLLGKREPEIYGHQTLSDIENRLKACANEKHCELACYQSNIEGELINYLHASMHKIDGIIINPGAFTHTSIALRDAFLSVQIPFIEVHISNVYSREPFRQHSYLSDIAAGLVIGCGIYGYELGLLALIQQLTIKK